MPASPSGACGARLRESKPSRLWARAIAIGAITAIGIMVMIAYHAVRIGLAIFVVLPLGIACAVAGLFFESDKST